MRYHYIYKITPLLGKYTGYYYLGKHTTRDIIDISKDRYAGSGKILKLYYSKYGKIEGITYSKEILEFNPSREANNERERIIIGELYKTDPKCLNLKCGGEGRGWEPGMVAINKGKKATEETKKKISIASSKPILQYDLEGNFIKEWRSEKEANDFYNGTLVGEVARGKKPSCYGYMWRFKNGNIEQKINPFFDKRKSKIKQYTKDNIFIKEWNTITEAAKEYGVTAGAIFNALNHRNRYKTSAGYIWKYA